MPTNVPTVRIDELPTDAVLLDVREDDEWAAGHIDGALHIPMNQLPQRLHHEPDVLPTGGAVVVLCRVGGRSAQVTAWLRHQGYDAVNLEGGMLEWAYTKRPMICESGAEPHVY